MCSFTLGHRIIPFLSTLVVQIGTMKCFYWPQKDASVVPWDSFSPDDQIFLQDKYPDAGQGAVCVRSPQPSAFFSRSSSSTSSSAPQSVDSGLQVPSAPLLVSGAATSLATESVESGVVEPSASVAESSTAATGPATGSHQNDYCRTALVADQSHKDRCTPTQHTVRWEWEACVHSFFSGKLCLCSENDFSPQDK